MNGIVNLPAFIAAGILLNITPGADTMYILGRSIAQGRQAGIYSVFGIITGVVCHTVLAAFGLSLIVARSATAFNMIKYAGALYLAYLGIKMIANRKVVRHELEKNGKTSQKLYLSGLFTNLLNPKVILFFLVFMPQFVKTSEAHNPLPFLILGAIFIVPGTIWCLLLAVFAASFSKKLRSNNNIAVRLNMVTGGIFISLGIKLAIMSKN